MNEPSNFCPFPCDDPYDAAKRSGSPPDPPPVRKPPRPLPGFSTDAAEAHSTPASSMPEEENIDSEFPEVGSVEDGEAQAPLEPRAPSEPRSKDKEDLLYPPYKINNHWGHADLSDRTARTDIVHAGGHRHYDTHNLYGLSMKSFPSRGRTPC